MNHSSESTTAQLDSQPLDDPRVAFEKIDRELQKIRSEESNGAVLGNIVVSIPSAVNNQVQNESAENRAHLEKEAEWDAVLAAFEKHSKVYIALHLTHR